MVRSQWIHALLALGMLAGCGSSDDDPCELGTHDGCDDGEVCEEVVGGEPACFAPAHIEGRVFDLFTDVGIEGARVVAMDSNDAARSDVVVSGAAGAYSLPIHIRRDAEGQPVTDFATLRVWAQGYVRYPKLPRPAIPLDVSTAVFDEDAGRWVVGGAATDVGLLEVEEDAGTFGTITGRIVLADGFEAPLGGILVIAEVDGVVVSTAIADLDGHFVLFNVPPGSVTITAYAAGVAVQSEVVTVAAGEDTGGVELVATTEGLSTVSGSVNIVDGGGNDVTSVILIPESTLEELIPDNASFVRGEAPQGLRAADVSGAFSIEGVPPGRYAVLAAFENDGLTRDPDQNRAGTDVVFVEVTGDGSEITIGESFKVTQAVDVVWPGATGLEVIADPAPTFEFQRMSNVSRYELRVFNAYGNLVYEVLDIEQPGGGGGAPVSFASADSAEFPALEDGMIYQFRVIAVSDTPTPDLYRYATEDMLGVFAYDPSPPVDEGDEQ
jgi:hypothetical protein